MATRINTKFVVILAAALVIMTAGGVYAVMRLNKSAQDHVRIAENALNKAQEALAAGDIEKANAQFTRASNNFYAAKSKEANNTEHLYRFIQARDQIRCSEMTLAMNEVGAILSIGAAGIHDTPSASNEDRDYVYNMFLDWHRMRPGLNNVSPLAYLNRYTSNRLDTHPEDTTAQRYRAIFESFVIGTETDEEDRIASFQQIIKTQQANPNDPWLKIAVGRAYLLEARRLYRLNGGSYSEDTYPLLDQAEQNLINALHLAKEDPAATFEAVSVLIEVHRDDKEAAARLTNNKVKAIADFNAMLGNTAMREQLHTEELARAVAVLQAAGKGSEQVPFDGKAAAKKLALALVKERNNEPAAYTALGNYYQTYGQRKESADVFERGLAIKRNTSAIQFVRDQQARIEMTSRFAETQIDFAALAGNNKTERDKALGQARHLIKQFKDAPGTVTDLRDARANYLQGRVELIAGKPAQAIDLFNKANQVYKDSDSNTLRFLALTHAHPKLRNTAMAVELFEKIVLRQPASPLRLNLISLYLSQRDNKSLARAETHLIDHMSRKPGDADGIKLMARLLAQRGEPGKAIAMLQQLDLDADPALREDIARYQAMAGDTKGVIQLLRKQISDSSDNPGQSLQLVTQLINLIPDKEAKLQELARLKEQKGLDSTIIEILNEMIQNGRVTLEQELTLLDSQGLEPATLAINQFQTYQRRGMQEQAQAAFAKAVRADPKNPIVIEWRYRLALQAGEWSKAEQATQDMMAIDPSIRPQIAIGEGAFMRSQTQAVRATQMSPGTKQTEQLRAAASAYRQALADFPAYADGWTQLGRIQLVQGNFIAAKSSLREALSLQGQDIEALESIAIAEVNTGDIGLAMGRYETILTINPDHPTALNRFTALATQNGRPQEAIAQRERTRERRPNNFANRRALTLLYAEQGHIDQARAEIDAVILSEGQTLENTATLAQLMLANEQTEEATQLAGQFLASRGEDTGWRDHLVAAQVYEKAGNTTLADAQFANAVDAEDKQTINAALAWGQALQKRGALQQATELFLRLSIERPNNNILKARAGQLLIQNKKFEKGESLVMQLPETPDRARLMIESAIAQNNGLGIPIQRARAAAKRYPDNFELRERLCRLILGQIAQRPEDDRDFTEAIAMADAIQADFPERAKTKILIADILLGQNKTEQAVEIYQKMLDADPSQLSAQRRIYVIRLNEAQRLANSNPEASVEQATQALNIISSLIRNKPELTDLNRSAGQAAQLAGRFTEAASYYRNAYRNSRSVQDLLAYTNALLGANRADEALTVLQNPKNVSLVSNTLALRAMRGRALAAAGEIAKAEALFTNTLQANRENTQERSLLAQEAYLAFKEEPERFVAVVDNVFGGKPPLNVDDLLIVSLLENRRYEQAAKRLAIYEDMAFERANEQLSLLLRLALARQELGQYSEAKATYERCLAIAEDNQGEVSKSGLIQLHNNLAFMLADKMQGYQAIALAHARKAYQLIPDNAPPQNYALIGDTLGWALYKAGQEDEAMKVLRKSVDQHPTAVNQLHLGRIHLARGDKNRAIVLLEAALNHAKAQGNQEETREAQRWFDEAIKQ